MFAAVMSDKENCRMLLEMVLGFPVRVANVNYEHSIFYNPDYKGVRLDILAVDEHNNHYNVELQLENRHIAKRSRYYHSQMDMKMLESGDRYKGLPDAYVIFICDYDPVGAGKYRYTIDKYYKEVPDRKYDDGSYTIFLSTKGTNDDEVPKELVSFLKYVAADLNESTDDYDDNYVKKLQKSVADIKQDRGKEKNFMLLEEMLQDELEKGEKKSIIYLLSDLGEVPEALMTKISSEDSEARLMAMLRLAAKAESIEMFSKELDKLNV